MINADDYYGKEAYREAYACLMEQGRAQDGKLRACMVGFVLGNTLSDNGGVTRGVCRVDEEHRLLRIRETHDIQRTSDGTDIKSEEGDEGLCLDSVVSMNMWGLTPAFFDVLEEGFEEFFGAAGDDCTKAEFLLPTFIGELLVQDRIEVRVLYSNDKWFGVTYKEDKETVVQAVRELIASGMYPDSGTL